MRALRELCGEQCLPVPRLQLRRAKLGLVSYTTLSTLFQELGASPSNALLGHQQTPLRSFIAASFKTMQPSIAANSAETAE